MSKRLKYGILTSVSVLMVIVIVLFVSTDKAYKTSVEVSDFKPTIVIDPGHGGNDGGAMTDNILEKNINLEISLILREFLVSNGFDVVMTRDTDIALYNSDITNHKKQSDLQNRVEVFNSSPDNIAISIHQNKFAQEKYSGTQIFFSGNNDKSPKLAENIKNSVVTLIQPDNQRECKKSGSEIYVLDKAQVPAVLIECGFLSNSAEAKKLNSKAYQTQLAYCIYLGFLEYYYTNY